LSRSLVATLALAFSAGACGGIAHASERPLHTHIVRHGETLAALAAREGDGPSTFAAPGGEAKPYEISAAARAELAAIGTASNMPSADADMRMWSVAEANASAKHAHRIPADADPIHRFARGIISRTSSLALSLTRSALRFIGTPYVFGGTSPSGFDCSGYTQHVFAMLGISLPRTADAQYYAGHPTVGGMVPGDLVFFQTYLPGPSHVGIYLGGGRFIHSSSHGVRISGLGESYWASRYLGARRMVATVAAR
jgi:cell wall-associated NlpC family hydrolase